MTAPHFFVDAGVYGQLRVGDLVRLSLDDSAHALRSRRLRPGEEVTVSNGHTWLARGRLLGEEVGEAVVELHEVWPIGYPRSSEIDVSLAPPKGDRLAWAVQKLSELGVHEVNLVETERSIRFPSKSGLSRLATIAREAAMQSAQPMVMRVGRWEDFPQAIARRAGVDIMLHEGAPDRLNTVLPNEAGSIHLLVGPEGGFSDSEVSQARGAGFRIASLGPAILRTETAAVVGAALVLARYGRLG